MGQARSIGPNMEWGWQSNEVQIPGTKNALYKAFLDSLVQEINKVLDLFGSSCCSFG